MEIQGGWGSKAKVPSFWVGGGGGGMDIFWNYTSKLSKYKTHFYQHCHILFQSAFSFPVTILLKYTGKPLRL